MGAPKEITPSQLSRLIGTAGFPTILDIRTDEDFQDDHSLIPGGARLQGVNRCVVVCQGGERCTFDNMLSAFGLRSDPLAAMAQVSRAAHTGRWEKAPQAAGLLALTVGLPKLHRDDNAQPEAGLTLYEALFRWARDGLFETHESLTEAAE